MVKMEMANRFSPRAALCGGLAVLLLVGTGAQRLAAQSTDEIVVENAILELIETVEVPAEVSGILGEITVVEGRVVDKGQELSRVRDEEAINRIRGTQIEVRRAEVETLDESELEYAMKALGVANAEMERALQANRELVGTYSEYDVERLRLLVDKAEAEVKKAEHQQRLSKLQLELKSNELELGEILLDKHRVRAPLAGMIVNVGKRTGEWIQAGDALFTIVRIDKLRVEGLVSADLATRLTANEKAILRVSLPSLQDQTFAGQVVFISPEANPVSGQVRIWAEVENPAGKLRPGLRGTLTILPESP